MTFSYLTPQAKRQLGQMQASIDSLTQQAHGRHNKRRRFGRTRPAVTGLTWQGQLEADLYIGGTSTVSFAEQLGPTFEPQVPVKSRPIVWMANPSGATPQKLLAGSLVSFAIDEEANTAALISSLELCPQLVGDGSVTNQFNSYASTGTGTAWSLVGLDPTVTVTGSSQDLIMEFGPWGIPANLAITGVQVSLAIVSNGRQNAAIEAMSLTSQGVIIPGTTVTGAAGTPLPATGQTIPLSYGGEGDLMGWSGTPTDTDVSFGASLKVQRDAAQQDATVIVLSAAMTIFGSNP